MTDPDFESARVLELAEEFIVRYRAGQRPSLREYIDRYPELADEVREVFPALAMLENIALADESLAGDPTADHSKSRVPERLGDFRIIRELGRGGMGVVYEAEQVSLGRHVALKTLPERMLRDPNKRLRFEREARAAGRLHHTNIVPVFGVGEHDGTPYYVMQFIPGQGLDAVLDELRRLRAGDPREHDQDRAHEATAAEVAHSLWTGHYEPTKPDEETGSSTAEAEPTTRTADEPEPGRDGSDSKPATGQDGREADPRSVSSSSASLLGQGSGIDIGPHRSGRTTYWQGIARIGMQVAEALAYAHAQGVLHRDIKPSNLLLDARGAAWVADFGLAKLDDRQDLTLTGDLLGTLRYMPPEALEGRHDARGDIYSLGLTLYELLAFRPAFDETSRGRLIRRLTDDVPSRLGRLNPEVPRDLETVVHKAIEKDPHHRYQAASELAEDLRRFLEDRPVRARRASESERFWRWCRRNPAIAALAGSLAAILLLITAASLLVAATFHDQAAALRMLASDKEAESKKAHHARVEAQVEAERASQAARSSLVAEAAAESERDRANSLLYTSNMRLAQELWEHEEGTARAIDVLLAERIPRIPRDVDPRDIAWRFQWTRLHRGVPTFFGPPAPTFGAIDHRDRLRVLGRGMDLLLGDVSADRIQPGLHFGRKGPAWCYSMSPDGSMVARGEGLGATLHLFDTRDGREIRTIEGPAPLRDVEFSPDGRHIVSLWFDQRARVHEIATGVQLGEVRLRTKMYRCLALMPGGGTVLLGDHPSKASITAYDVTTGRATVLRGHGSVVSSLAASPDGRRFASGGSYGLVLLWDAQSLAQVEPPLQGHTGAVRNLAFSSDGRRLASGDDDGQLRIWMIEEGLLSKQLKGHTASITLLNWESGGESLLSGDESGEVKVWRPTSSDGSIRFNAGEHLVGTLAASPDGRLLAGIDLSSPESPRERVRLWDVPSESTLLELESDRAEAESSPVLPPLYTSVALTPGGSSFAVGGGDSSVVVRDIKSRRIVQEFKGIDPEFYHTIAPDASMNGPANKRVVNSLAFSVDGTMLAAGYGPRFVLFGDYNQFVKVWDVRSGRELASLGVGNTVVLVHFSPDGKVLTAVCRDGTIRLWKIPTWEVAGVFRVAEKQIIAAAVSPDQSILAAGLVDGTIHLFERTTGRALRHCQGHPAMVRGGLAFSPDGRVLASFGWPGQSLMFWDVAHLRELFHLSLPSKVRSVLFSPAGDYLALATSEEIKLWPVASLAQIDEHSTRAARRRESGRPTRDLTTPSPAPASITAEQLDALTGRYGLVPEFTLEVQRRGDQLVAAYSEKLRLVLIPVSSTEFVCQENGALFRFSAADPGREIGLMIEQDGRTLRARRVLGSEARSAPGS